MKRGLEDLAAGWPYEVGELRDSRGTERAWPGFNGGSRDVLRGRFLRTRTRIVRLLERAIAWLATSGASR
jgi:hypothetical protein